MIRVLIADDKRLVRDAIQALLCRDKDIQVVGEAHDGQEAIDLFGQLHPDVVTMDIKMPRIDGVEALRRICTPPNHTGVLVVAMSWEDDLVKRAMEGGAKGYVAKPDMFRELVPAIRSILAGKRYFSTKVTESLSSSSPQ